MSLMMTATRDGTPLAFTRERHSRRRAPGVSLSRFMFAVIERRPAGEIQRALAEGSVALSRGVS
jgi:hypothetical protein